MNSVENVLPRYMRVPVNSSVNPPVVDYFIDDVENLDVVDDSGNSVRSVTQKVKVPASDHYAKFTLADFKLQSMIEHGVQLSYINAASEHGDLSRILNISEKLEALESYGKLIDKQRSEINDFFQNSNNLKPSENE